MREVSLHLLRNLPPKMNGQPTDPETFLRLVRRWGRHESGAAGFWTRRRPRRAAELAGGSVYFVVRGLTMFRMPWAGIERVRDFAPDATPEWLDAWAIVCRPQAVLVRSQRIYRLQGWRYLDANDAPADL